MKRIQSLLITGAVPENRNLIRLFSDASPLAELFSWAVSLEEGMHMLKRQSFDLLFLDISSKGGLPENAFYLIHRQFPKMPVIVITDKEDEATILPLLRSDAQDYLIRGRITPELIGHTAAFAIERYRMRISLKQKTEQIQFLKESLEAIIRQSADAILMIDESGHICFANPAAAEIFGRSQHDLIGQDFGFPVSANQTMELDLVCPGGKKRVIELKTVWIDWKNSHAYLASIRDITAQKERQRHMQMLSFHDQLTGLYNRAYFDENSKNWNTEDSLPLGLIVGDVDNLKLSNDTLGHQYGDRMLVSIVSVMQKVCRPQDIMIRYGGDEFIILVPRCTELQIRQMIRDIQSACANLMTENVPSSISMGYAVKYHINQPLLHLLHQADRNMYGNKLACGRGRPNFYLLSLEDSLQKKDTVTSEHAVRVRETCFRFSVFLGLDMRTAKRCALVAALHDIGKIAIPSSILNKEGPLDDEEWEIMKHHPAIGCRMIKDLPGMNDVAEAILSHHERWDGKGYPRGIADSQIPLTARILSLVDAFDAMTHDRPYRKAMKNEKALNEILRCRGTQFDPRLSDEFIRFIKKKHH